MPTPIIFSKLFAPPLRPDLVERPKLRDKFAAGLHRKATLVSAPAGFGKSTLVAACVAACGRDVAWLSLDSSDSEFSRFLAYLIAAIQRVDAGFGESLIVSLNAQQRPSDEMLLATLVNELATLQRPLVLVLDDYHLLDSTAVDSALSFLLQHLPPQVHCVIATREDPQLPLAQWRAKGLLTEIRVADLRFSVTEANAFLTQTMQLQLSEASIAALEARTEGWVAGLQLAALSLQAGGEQESFIRAFTGSHRFVLDYLAEEVLQCQSVEDRDFMLRSSVLDRLHGPLCDVLTECVDSEATLQRLERSNLFVIPLDDHRCWFRFHHLFKEVLHTRLLQQHMELLPELHLRAGTWYEENGFPVEAIQHVLAAEDFEQAATLIEKIWPTLRTSEPESTLLNWMQQISEAQVLCRPVLCAHYGLSLLSTDLQRGGHYFDAAERCLADPSFASGLNTEEVLVSNTEALAEVPGLLAVGRAYQAAATGDAEGVVEHAQRALGLLNDNAFVWRGAAAVLLGLVYWAQGSLESAAAAITEGHSSLKAGGDISGAISTLYLLANLHIALGQLAQATAYCKKGQRLAANIGGAAPQGTADIYVMLAAIKAEQNQLQAADECLLQARELGEQAVLLESRHLWYVVNARIESLAGNADAALASLDQAAEQQLPSPAPDPMPIDAWRARVFLLDGQLSAAEMWAEAAQISWQDELSYPREFEHLVMAKILLCRYRQHAKSQTLLQAKTLLQRLREAASVANRQLRVVECDTLLALVHEEQGDKSAAEKHLNSALAQAEAQECVSVFLSEGEQMKALLRRLNSGKQKSAYASTVLAAFAGAPDAPAPVQPLTALQEPLSERELDVLRLLNSELSGPEIAAQLFVSLNTLRTHTKHIYAKLGVNSRRAAVNRATELGLR